MLLSPDWTGIFVSLALILAPPLLLLLLSRRVSWARRLGGGLLIGLTLVFLRASLGVFWALLSDAPRTLLSPGPTAGVVSLVLAGVLGLGARRVLSARPASGDGAP